MIKKIIFLFLSIFLLNKLNAATIKCVASTDWNTTTTWNTGTVPNIGDSVVIPTGFTVGISATPSFSTKSLNIQNGGTLNFSAIKTLILTGSLTLNGTAAIGGSATGTINSVNFIVASGANAIIGGLTMNISGTSQISGLVTFTATAGTPTFTGDVTVGTTGAINFSAGQTLTLSNKLIMTAGSSMDGTATGIIKVGTTLTTGAGGTVTFGNLSITIASTSAINGTLLFSSASGTPIFTGDVTVGAAGAINFSAIQVVAMSGNLISTAGATIGGGGAVGTINVAGNFSVLTGGTTTLGGLTLSIKGNITIPGTAVLNASAAKNTIILTGNWTATSSSSPDFIYGTSLVTLNGILGTQTISSSTAGGETFYSLTLANSSVTSPAVQFSQNITVKQAYNQTGSGSLDLVGHTLLVASVNNTGAFITCTLSGGKIISSTASAAISFTDANDSTNVLFAGTNVGSATQAIPLTINVGRMCLSKLELYGVGNFTKSLDYTGTNCGGGNKYHNKITFTSPATGSHWRMGDNGAPPDTFLAVSTFNANANGVNSNNNFILGVGSSGNYYADSVYLTSTTTGGLFIGRSNDTKTNSHTFKGPVVVNVTFTGNVTFGESSSTRNDSVFFKNSLQLNSSVTSTGDIYLGNVNGYSTVNIINPGQLVDGSLNGATNVYLYGVIQTGNNSQISTSTAASNSTFIVGSLSAPCTWNGPVTITSPNINLTNSTYNGTPNIFTANGSANQTCTGGNSFASGTTTTFANNGAGYWELANTNADAYSGNVIFNRTGAGSLSPAYNTSCNFGGNITVAFNSDSIDFATGASGRVILSGTSSGTFASTGLKGTSMKRITMNKTGGASFTLNNPVGIQSAGDLTLISGLLNTSAAGLLVLNSNVTTTALTDASVSYVNGPLKYQLKTNTVTNLNLPIGKSPDCRPAILTVQHTSATNTYNYTAEVFDANPWTAMGSTMASQMPSTVDTISGVHYWKIDRTDNSGTSQPSFELTGNQKIQVFFGTNDKVFQGSTLTIVKNTAATPASWIDIGGTSALGNFSSAQAGSVTSTSSPTAFNSFSSFTLGSRNAGWNPLPINLLTFTATPNNSNVDVKWETTTETNNNYFTVEKSTDGQNFTKVINVMGAGNSTSNKNYATIDTIPYNGISYYRLKQTDFNGNFEYFNIVPVNFSASLPQSQNITLHPNPNNGIFIIETNSSVQQALLMYDVNGRIVLNQIINGKTNLDLSNLSEGVYNINLTSNDGIINKRMVIVR